MCYKSRVKAVDVNALMVACTLKHCAHSVQTTESIWLLSKARPSVLAKKMYAHIEERGVMTQLPPLAMQLPPYAPLIPCHPPHPVTNVSMTCFTFKHNKNVTSLYVY